MKHKHAELMMQYAQDAMETDKPWERWEFYNKPTESWLGTTNHPNWDTVYKYRRKPKMISVTFANGEVVSWPEPHRTELEYGDAYYYVNADGTVSADSWDCLEWESDILSNGWLHLTEEAAKQHATALRKINTQGRDDG